MTTTIIISLCILVLIAYIFDITASKTKIPSVILLLLLGFMVKVIADSFHLRLPNLNPILPILGTIGLILIVLEGSLELEIKTQKRLLILKSSIIALILLFITSFGIAGFLYYFNQIPFKLALANAIPLGVVSSAIAIPSARNLFGEQKEYITYESSLSDIFGVIFFNFITLNDNIGTKTLEYFAIDMLLMLVISFVATLLLAGFLNTIKHHIKFMPMMVLVILIYSVSKIFHLPALIFILIFGLFIGNINQLRSFRFVRQFHPINFTKDLHKFREITTEMTFLIRALFFILFGFLIEANDVLNTETIILALGITSGIFLLRFLILWIFDIPTNPLTFIAPRGLITILLFLSIPITKQTPLINNSLITQVIILSTLVMMFGLMKYKKPIYKITEEEKK